MPHKCSAEDHIIKLIAALSFVRQRERRKYCSWPWLFSLVAYNCAYNMYLKNTYRMNEAHHECVTTKQATQMVPVIAAEHTHIQSTSHIYKRIYLNKQKTRGERDNDNGQTNHVIARNMVMRCKSDSSADMPFLIQMQRASKYNSIVNFECYKRTHISTCHTWSLMIALYSHNWIWSARCLHMWRHWYGFSQFDRQV